MEDLVNRAKHIIDENQQLQLQQLADVERSEHEMQLIRNTLRALTTVFGEINQGQEPNRNGPP